jgi:signal recognition particle GTPase
MIKTKRRKIVRENLENQLIKMERRIQKIAEAAYHIRQAIEHLDREETLRQQKIFDEATKIEGKPQGGQTDAVHSSGETEGIVGGTTESQG